MPKPVSVIINNAFSHTTSWHETLLPRLRTLPGDQARKTLEHILTCDPKEIEAHFYYNHYFVMKFMGEHGQWLNNKDFLEKQIDDFFRFSWNDGKSRSFDGNKTWERFMSWVSSVKDSWVSFILQKKLLAIAEDENQDGWLRSACAEALGQSGMKDKAVEMLFLVVEDKSRDEGLRGAFAGVLGRLGIDDKAVTDRLLALAEDENQDGWLRSGCARAVGSLDIKDKAVDILIELYITQTEKISDEARLLYDSLWDLIGSR